MSPSASSVSRFYVVTLRCAVGIRRRCGARLHNVCRYHDAGYGLPVGAGRESLARRDRARGGGELNRDRGGRRTEGEVEIHDKETDTFHVLEGEATLITGGAMTGGKVTAPNQQRGKNIIGGETYHLSKGDVIVIPAGIPHWFKEVPKSIDYYVVKVIKP